VKTFKSLCFLLLLFLTDCSIESRTLDFDDFQILVPQQWEKIELIGIDSKVGGISLNGKDTVTYDLGLYSDDLDEYIAFEDYGDSVYVFDGYNDSPIFKFKGSIDDLDKDKFYKNEVNWDEIDGFSAKIVRPKRSGFGVTGVYIDSLYQSEFGKIGFQISGYNLSPDNERLFLQAIKTVTFK